MSGQRSETMHEAGRETDALVAEKVMGIRTALNDYGEKVGVTSSDGRFQLHHYSTKIAAAWEVVEKLREKRIYLTVSACHDRYDVDVGWEGAMLPGEDIWRQAFASAPTAPLAIVRAALAAMETGEGAA